MWIAPLKVLSTDGDEVRLGVPNRFVLDWIENRYLPEMRATLAEGFECSLDLVLVIDPELYRERRQEGEEILAARRAEIPSDPCLQASLLPSAAQKHPGAGSQHLGTGSQHPGTGRQHPDAGRRPAAGGPLAQSLDTFVVGRANELAYNAALQVLESPGALLNPFFIHGPPGVGKTHLLKGLHGAFRARRGSAAHGGASCQVRYLSSEQFFQQYAASVHEGNLGKFRERFRSLEVLIVDDIHLLVNKRKTQIEFLHTFNSLVESGRQIILASDSPPKAMSALDPALTGRFLSGLVTSIRPPDLEMRLGILRGHALLNHARVREEVLRFVAESVRGSAREVIGALRQLEIHTQLAGAPLGIEEARLALAELIREQERQITLERVKSVVVGHYGLTAEQLLSPSRQRHVVRARQAAMYLSREYTKETLGAIGSYFGRRNHTTVRNAVGRVAGALAQGERGWQVDLEALRAKLES